MNAHKEKPILVVTAFNAPGHTAPLLQISEHLTSRGYTVYFIAGPGFKEPIERMGAIFVESDWRWLPVLLSAPADKDELWNMKHVFVDSAPLAYRTLKSTLERVQKEYPTRQVLIIHESISQALAPLYQGAPLPDGYAAIPKTINFHTSVATGKDYNFPPFGPGLPYDPTPENLALYRSMHEAMEPAWESVNAHCNAVYDSLGATRPVAGNFMDRIMTAGDVTIMATSPSLEYPNPNRNPNLRFIGGLPLKPLSQSFVPPTWWPNITTNAALPPSSPDKKKLIFVTQGTAHVNYTELIIPSLRALASHDDLIVVVTLGTRGASLPSDVPIPANAIVTDYLAYDAILPHTDVFISNAGYGGFMHGVMNGVPMVLAGMMADKGEVGARAEWAGIAVNLRAQRPEEGRIREAVERVLADGGFRRRAMELRRENEEMRALERFEGVIEELIG